MALTRALRGDDLTMIDWLAPAAMAFLVALLCISAISHLLTQERIVFGRS
jgi:hypothetical protein